MSTDTQNRLTQFVMAVLIAMAGFLAGLLITETMNHAETLCDQLRRMDSLETELEKLKELLNRPP